MKARPVFFFLLAMAAVLVVLPALSTADTGYSTVFSNWVSNGTIQTVNGCNIIFNIAPNATSVHIEVQGLAGTEDVTVGTGNPYYYSTLLMINVVSIDSNRSQAYVDIEKPVATATAAPTGTRIYCDTPGQLALAGDTVTFPVVIQNYDADRTYTLSASNDASWTTGFQFNGKNIYEIFVPQGQSKTVNLVVKTTYTTAVGEKHITVTADTYSIGLGVSITSANSTVGVSVAVDSVIASLGGNIYYDVSLQNLQPENSDYKLSVTGLPDGWYYRYVSARGSADEMAEAIVPASGTKNIVLQIVPPLSAQVGDYSFTAVVTTPDGVNITEDLTLKLKGSVSMSVTTDQLAYSTSPGQSFDIKVYVTNNGQGGSLTNVYPNVEAPSGWTVNVTPASVNSIKPGETQVYTVSVLPPANIVANVYAVNIAVKSDQSTSATSNYQITITTSSIIPYLGGALVLAVIGGLVLMYRKYGRR